MPELSEHEIRQIEEMILWYKRQKRNAANRRKGGRSDDSASPIHLAWPTMENPASSYIQCRLDDRVNGDLVSVHAFMHYASDFDDVWPWLEPGRPLPVISINLGDGRGSLWYILGIFCLKKNCNSS